jgi:threonine synthase
MRYVSHLACTVCGTTFSAETPMNLCPHDGRPIQVLMDLDRLKAECGRDGWWNPARRDLWRFGGLLPLDIAVPELVDRGFIRSGNRVVLVNTASAEKYLPALRTSLDGGL